MNHPKDSLVSKHCCGNCLYMSIDNFNNNICLHKCANKMVVNNYDYCDEYIWKSITLKERENGNYVYGNILNAIDGHIRFEANQKYYDLDVLKRICNEIEKIVKEHSK